MVITVGNRTFSITDIFDSLEIPLVAVDERGALHSFNTTARMLLGIPAGRDPALFLEDLLPGGLPEEASGESVIAQFEAVCRKRNGEPFPAKVTVTPLAGGDQRIVVIQDISKQRKLQQRAVQRTKELSVFNAFAAILTEHAGTVALLEETVRMLMRHMGADKGWLFLFDERAQELHPAVHLGFTAEQLAGLKPLKPGESLTGKVFTSGKALLVHDAQDDPRVKFKHLNFGSMIAAPISSKGVVLGVIGIACPEPSLYTSMDIQLLSTIGSQIGVALENARLITALRDKMEHIELTNELSGIINSSLSIGTIFRMVAVEIRNLIDYDRASLLLYDEKKDNLLIFALDTDMKTVMKKGVRAPVEGTSAGWVVRNNKPWINRDLAHDAFPLDRKLLGEGIRSTVSIPLFHDRILGVFNLDSTEPGAYADRHLDILLPIAKHISIALENALLFEEISKERKEWAQTFDAITDMVWIEDGRQRVIRANRALLERAGLSSFQVGGKPCRELLSRIGITPSVCLCVDTMTTKKPSFLEIRGDGGSLFQFWAYPLLDEEGGMYAIVHYLKDVTARKHLEQQLVRSERLASLGTLVAGIAHEINNPLGIIAGYSEALLDRLKSEPPGAGNALDDFPEYLETIHREIFRCKGILRGLLDFARPSVGTFRDIDINELIKEVILLVNHRARRMNHRIELSLNRDLPRICAEPGSLRQLFMNIIINSLYYTPEQGHITIATDVADAAHPDAGAGNPAVRVTVSDTGTGISPEIAGKIFDPFFTTKPVGDGTGLGLAICHKIVEEHGGSIDARSVPGKGATFTIILPVRRSDDTGPCR